MKENNIKDIQRKTISFGPSEKDLYDYVIKQCKLERIKFATYIKKLIRESKDNKSLDSLLEEKLDKYFKNKDLSINTNNSETKVSKKYKKEDKQALFNFMKK